MTRAAAVAVLGAVLAWPMPATSQDRPPGSGPDASAVSPGAPEAPVAVVETPKGSFTIGLLPDVAPNHVKHGQQTCVLKEVLPSERFQRR